MSPLPAAATRAMRRHRIALPKDSISFKEGRALCTCGVLVTANPEPRFDRDEALADAWLSHRRDVGLMKPGSLGYEHDGVARVFRVAR